jgi:hypothetical protein
MKYNSNTLITYCNENNITLIDNSNIINNNINRESYIELKCIECFKQFTKNFRQLVKTGAYCQKCMNNIATNKIRESKVKYDINMLINFCDENNILLMDDYSDKFINRDSKIEGICKNDCCENIFNKSFRELLKINGFCQDCSKENGKLKIIETNLKKYGVDNPMKNEECKEKLKQSILKKYGIEHNSQSEIIKNKKRETYIKNFGVSSHLKSKEIREQIKQTNLIKYGVENPQQNKDIKEKTMNTNLELYGCKSPTGNILVKSKVIQTNLERYGVPHHSQNPEVSENMMKNAYNKKSYSLPSGKIIFLQGYENFMLDYLLSVEKIDEDDIFTKRNEVPEIWYYDKIQKQRRHYVDFYIKSQNRCVEVKSTFTNQEKNNVFEKQKAAKDLGLKYEIWIFNKSGELLDKYI